MKIFNAGLSHFASCMHDLLLDDKPIDALFLLVPRRRSIEVAVSLEGMNHVPIVVDPSMPRDTVELRDKDGNVVGKITNLAIPMSGWEE